MHPPFPEAEVWRCGLWMTVSERQHVVIPRQSNPGRDAVGGPTHTTHLHPTPDGVAHSVPTRKCGGGTRPGFEMREMGILGPPTVLLRRYFVGGLQHSARPGPSPTVPTAHPSPFGPAKAASHSIDDTCHPRYRRRHHHSALPGPPATALPSWRRGGDAHTHTRRRRWSVSRSEMRAVDDCLGETACCYPPD